MRKVHLVVEHPSTGRFVARKLNDPDEKKVNYSITMLGKFLKSRFGWKDPPSITTEEIDDEQRDNI